VTLIIREAVIDQVPLAQCSLFRSAQPFWDGCVQSGLRLRLVLQLRVCGPGVGLTHMSQNGPSHALPSAQNILQLFSSCCDGFLEGGYIFCGASHWGRSSEFLPSCLYVMQEAVTVR